MLYQELPRIDSSPLDGWGRWLVPALAAAFGISAAVILLAAGQPLLAAVALVLGLGAGGFAYAKSPTEAAAPEQLLGGPDYSLVGASLGLIGDPVALTSAEGSLLVVNPAYRDRFGAAPPMSLAANDDARQGLELALSMARRDGAGCVAGIETSAGLSPVEVDRVGAANDLLLWRFPHAAPLDPLAIAARRMDGAVGSRLVNAGVAAAVVDAKGQIISANGLFADRAVGPGQSLHQARFADLVEVGEDDQMRLVAEGEGAPPVRAVHIPADPAGEGGAGTFLLFDTTGGASAAQSSNLQALLDVLPIGLALVDRDGRFLTMNAAFRQAAGLKGNAMPSYPGDLVVKEDKAPVADAVRRNARHVRRPCRPPEPPIHGTGGADYRWPPRLRRCDGPPSPEGQ
jgi:two-component system cell cycle sensor histidine kinase/response regulator CckA